MNKIVKISLALVMTAAVMMFARATSRGRPVDHVHIENGYSFSMTTVPKGIEFTEETISLSVTPAPPEGGVVVFRRAEKGRDDIDDLSSYSSLPMVVSGATADQYETVVKAGAKAGRFKYYFDLVDVDQKLLARFTDENKTSFDFRYIGAVPIYVLGPHLLFIFATFFAVSMAALSALPLVTGRTTDCYPAARWLFWSVVFSFLGCYPFGIPMNWYAFGGTWEGVPFGTDATDNKTQLMLVYLVFAWLAGLGSFYKLKEGRDLYAPRTFGLVGLGGLCFTLLIYAIPHSIQFSAGLTYAVCYGFIGLISFIYLIGYVRAGKRY